MYNKEKLENLSKSIDSISKNLRDLNENLNKRQGYVKARENAYMATDKKLFLIKNKWYKIQKGSISEGKIYINSEYTVNHSFTNNISTSNISKYFYT